VVSARTMSLDPRTGRLFVAAADTDPSPTPNGRPEIRPGTVTAADLRTANLIVRAPRQSGRLLRKADPKLAGGQRASADNRRLAGPASSAWSPPPGWSLAAGASSPATRRDRASRILRRDALHAGLEGSSRGQDPSAGSCASARSSPHPIAWLHRSDDSLDYSGGVRLNQPQSTRARLSRRSAAGRFGSVSMACGSC
jgi:hypothetical protein